MVTTKRTAEKAPTKTPPAAPKGKSASKSEVHQHIELPKHPPDHITTHITDGDIRFPKSAFYGYPDEYKFGEYADQFGALTEALERNSMHFHCVGADKNGGFVAVVGPLDNPLFIWENYLGDLGKHEDNVYLNGIKMMVTTFLKKPVAEQDVLLEPLRVKAWMIQ